MKKTKHSLLIFLLLGILCLTGCKLNKDKSYRPLSNGNYYYTDRVVQKKVIDRNLPEVTGGNLRYPASTNPVIADLTNDEIDQIYAENTEIMNRVEQDILKNTLKKHKAADGQFFGSISDSTKATQKTLLIDTRRAGGRIVGFAPAGEIIKITLPKGIAFSASIGYEEPHFNIPREKYSKNLNRMPILMKSFALKEGDNYIGSPFGGSVCLYIYLPNNQPFEIKVEGVIETPVFQYGVTTNEEWQEIRNLPGLTAEIYTKYVRLLMPASKIRNIDDMEKAAEYWYKAGSMSVYATNQEYTRIAPVTINFDNYVAAGGAVNVGGKFTMQPLGAANRAVNYTELLNNNDWIDLHELNHSFQNSGNVRWGIEESGEITNNVLSVLTMILYSDIALKRTESPMGFRDDTTDPYNNFSSTMKWYSDDKITDYTQYWTEGGHHYNYFIFSDLAHALGVEKVIQLIRSYGDGSCPVLEGFNANAMNPNDPATVQINRRDFALRTAKILGYDMTYYLSETNKMHLPKTVIDEVKALGLPEFKPAANLYSYGRNDGKTASKTGRPFVVPANRDYEFDFVGKTLTPYEFSISSEPKAKFGTFTKQPNGKYLYHPLKTDVNDPFSFKIQLKDRSEIEFNGEIQFNYHCLEVNAWQNIQISDKNQAGLDKAIEKTKDTPSDLKSYVSNGISVPSNQGNNFHRTEGKFVVPKDGEYVFYTRADDASYFYLSTDSNKSNLTLIAICPAYTTQYLESNKSQTFTLKKGQILYFSLEVYNNGGNGGGQVAYKINQENILDIPSKDVFHQETSDLQIKKSSELKSYVSENLFSSPKSKLSQGFVYNNNSFSVVSAPKSTPDTKWENMIDGNKNNYYYSTEKGERKILLSFNEVISFNNFILTRHPANRNGDIKDFILSASSDGTSYITIYEGTSQSGNINVIFDGVAAQYFILEIKATSSPNNLTFAEINFGLSFDARKGLKELRNDLFSYSEKPNFITTGIYESNSLVELSGKMTAKLEFFGENLAIYGVKGAFYGKMEILIDGKSLGIVDLKSDATFFRSQLFIAVNLTNTAHVLEIRSAEGIINLDFIQINQI